MFAHGVHVGYRRPGAKQQARGLLLVKKRQAFSRQRKKTGGAAGKQNNQKILLRQRLCDVQNAARDAKATSIRNRMARRDDLNRGDRRGRCISRRHDETGIESPSKDLHQRPRHGDCGFAGPHHHDAPYLAKVIDLPPGVQLMPLEGDVSDDCRVGIDGV